jgi:DNA ligase (NAD+)
MAADQDKLQAIDQIGPKVAESVYEYFRNERNAAVIKGLLAAGVKPQPPQKVKAKGKLAGRTIVVTGELENFTRPQVEQAIRQAGGKASSSVSKKTDFVLAGRDAGSKLDKALKLGVKVISEQEFLQMINTD